ncbi:MAG: hypothetical protein JWN62_2182 [Acidimicrobiales bacterium]|nr:hypothetical protein [Acidimicrobiales bacterium]
MIEISVERDRLSATWVSGWRTPRPETVFEVRWRSYATANAMWSRQPFWTPHLPTGRGSVSLPEGTVKSRMRLALMKLRAEWNRVDRAAA